MSRRSDLAVLRIDTTALCALAPGVITGTSSALPSEPDPARTRCYAQLIESTAELEPGFSRGPLLDRVGAPIGHNVAVSGRPDGRRGYAAPVNDPIRATIAQLATEAVAEGRNPLRGTP